MRRAGLSPYKVGREEAVPVSLRRPIGEAIFVTTKERSHAEANTYPPDRHPQLAFRQGSLPNERNSNFGALKPAVMSKLISNNSASGRGLTAPEFIARISNSIIRVVRGGR